MTTPTTTTATTTTRAITAGRRCPMLSSSQRQQRQRQRQGSWFLFGSVLFLTIAYMGCLTLADYRLDKTQNGCDRSGTTWWTCGEVHGGGQRFSNTTTTATQQQHVVSEGSVDSSFQRSILDDARHNQKQPRSRTVSQNHALVSAGDTQHHKPNEGMPFHCVQPTTTTAMITTIDRQIEHDSFQAANLPSFHQILKQRIQFLPYPALGCRIEQLSMPLTTGSAPGSMATASVDMDLHLARSEGFNGAGRPFCFFFNLSIDLRKSHSICRGGEHVMAVLGQDQANEWLHYDRGAFVVGAIGNVASNTNFYGIHDVLDAMQRSNAVTP